MNAMYLWANKWSVKKLDVECLDDVETFVRIQWAQDKTNPADNFSSSHHLRHSSGNNVTAQIPNFLLQGKLGAVETCRPFRYIVKALHRNS